MNRNNLTTEEKEMYDLFEREMLKDEARASKSKSQKRGKDYIPLRERPYKPSEVSTVVTTHHSRALSDNKRTEENERLRLTLATDTRARENVKKIDLAIFSHLLSKDEQGLKRQFSSPSLFGKLKTDIVQVLRDNNLDRIKIVSFPYRNNDTKEGDLLLRATRIRTALKALYLHGETLYKEEINKLR